MKFPRLIVCFFSEVRYQQETMGGPCAARNVTASGVGCSALFGLLFSTTFINFKKLKKGAKIGAMRKATRLLIFFELFRCVISPTTLRHKLVPNKYLFLI
jgi:hypothetical protein